MLLVTGQQIVTIFQPSIISPFHYTCIRPKMVEMMCDEEGYVDDFAILEFMPFVNEDIVLINKNSVVAISDPVEEVASAYQAYLSQIDEDPETKTGSVDCEPEEIDAEEIRQYLAGEYDEKPPEPAFEFPHSGKWAGGE